MKKLPLLILAILFFAVPCQSLLAADLPAGENLYAAHTDPVEEDPFAEDDLELQVYDPIEPVNRGIFWFNDKLYFYLFKPVAKGWRIVPEPARISVDNFFTNLATPVRLVNSLLQFKFAESGDEIFRFIINSTIGVAGLFDPASADGFPKREKDLGQTFGHYGAGSGPYLILPIFGPSNLRDGIGRIGDVFLDPLPYFLRDGEVIAAKVLDGENELSLDKDTYEGIKKHEIDPYLFIRNAYEQSRDAKIKKSVAK